MNIFPKMAPVSVPPMTPTEIVELKRAYVALHENMEALQDANTAAVEAEASLPKEQRTVVRYNFKVAISRSTYVVKHCNLPVERRKELLAILKQVEDLELELMQQAEKLRQAIDTAMSEATPPATYNELKLAVAEEGVPFAKYFVKYAESRCGKLSPTWKEFEATYKVA